MRARRFRGVRQPTDTGSAFGSLIELAALGSFQPEVWPSGVQGVHNQSTSVLPDYSEVVGRVAVHLCLSGIEFADARQHVRR